MMSQDFCLIPNIGKLGEEREREREKLKFLPGYEENFTFTDDRSSFDL